jgi:SulP family sulfate permease
MLIVIGFPRITKAVPASLIAILVVFGLVSLLGIDTKKVVDIASVSGTLPHLHLPNVPLSWETLQLIFPYSLVMAGVGLVESLLTLNMVDEITASKGNANRESMAQGIANTINGFLGEWVAVPWLLRHWSI